MRARTGTITWPAWLFAAALIAALAALFIITAPEARADREGEYHEFEIKCRSNDLDNSTKNVWIDEGEEFDLVIKWRDRSGVGSWHATWDTNQADPVSAIAGNDFSVEDEEKHSKSELYSTFNHTFATLEDDWWEGQEEFYAGYAAVWKDDGDNHPGHYCRVYIRDDDTLRVKSVRAWGNPADGNTYRAGETIRMRFEINGKVQVPDDENIHIHWDDADGESHWREAAYNTELSTAFRPVYDYTVKAGDPKGSQIRVANDLGDMVGVRTDGWVTETTPQFSATWLQNYEQQQGTMTDPVYFGVDGTPKVTEVGISDAYNPAIGHYVVTDTNASPHFVFIDDSTTYREGDDIVVYAKFNQEVDVDGQVGMSIRVGSPNSWRGAWYLSGSGTDTLLFKYTVKASDRDTDGIGVDSGGIDNNGNRYGFTGSGTITAKGGSTLASPSYSGFRNNADTKVDGRPIAVQISPSSTPVKDWTYWTGEKILVEIEYNKEVDVSGTPAVQIDLEDENHNQGPATRRKAVYESGAGTKKLTFAYQVKETDKDANGFSVWPGAGDFPMIDGHVVRHGTAVKANPAYSGFRNDIYHKVDGSLGSRLPPEVDKIEVTSSPGSDGRYTVGDEIEMTVTFDKDLVITETTTTADTEQETTEDTEADNDENGITLAVQIGNSSVTFDRDAGEGEDDQLVFQYTVKEGDEDTNGIAVSSNSISVSGYTIKDADGNDAVLTHSALSDRSGQMVDAVAPTVDSVEIASRPAEDNTYDTNEEILIQVEFDEPVTVTGTPTIEMDLGGTPVTVDYSYTFGYSVLFGYTVAEGDEDTDGVTVTANSMDLGGGSITDAVGMNAELAHVGVTALVTQKVDGRDITPPTITAMAYTSTPADGEYYRENENLDITYTFDEDVTVTGTPYVRLILGSGESEVKANHHQTNGVYVTFRYTVQDGDQALNGPAIAQNGIQLSGGTIKDAEGNDANLDYPFQYPGGTHRVNAVVPDTTAPTVASLSITSRTGTDGYYGVGDKIEISVTFSETVLVTGEPTIEIEVGDNERDADYDSTDETRVKFAYVVQDDELDTDGITVAANAISLNGGTIKDPAQNAATLDHVAIMANSAHQVDGRDKVKPTITGVAFTSDPGSDNHYALNDVIEATVTFSEDVTMTAAANGDKPQLILKLDPLPGGSGLRSVFMAYDATDVNEITFTYTVVAQDRASDSAVVPANALRLNGATIQDEAENDAVLTHGQYFPLSQEPYEYHQVDGSRNSDTQTGGV